MKLIFEKSIPDRRGGRPLRSDVPTSINIHQRLLRDAPPALPQLSELDVVRHFTELSRRNFGVDTNFYPLGSCTMQPLAGAHGELSFIEPPRAEVIEKILLTSVETYNILIEKLSNFVPVDNVSIKK